VDIAARSAETVNAWLTAGRTSRQAGQRQRYFVSFAARDIGERQWVWENVLLHPCLNATNGSSLLARRAGQ